MVVKSLKAGNQNQKPTISNTYWQAIGDGGNTILNGTGAPVSTLGRRGNFYIDIANIPLCQDRCRLLFEERPAQDGGMKLGRRSGWGR